MKKTILVLAASGCLAGLAFLAQGGSNDSVGTSSAPDSGLADLDPLVPGLREPLSVEAVVTSTAERASQGILYSLQVLVDLEEGASAPDTAPSFALQLSVEGAALETWSDVQPGRPTLIEFSGGLSPVLSGTAEGWYCDDVLLDDALLASPGVIELIARPVGQLSGVVVDPEGVPVAGVRVGYSSRRSSRPLMAETALDGAFIIPLERGLRPGGDLTALAHGYAPKSTSIPSFAEERRLTLSRGWTVGGSVLDQDGSPVPDALVTWRPFARHSRMVETWLPSVGVSTDAAGRFRLPAVLPGKALFQAEFNGTRSEKAWTDGVSDGEEVELRMLFGSLVTVRVLTPEGLPVEGAEAGLMPVNEALEPRSARCDSEGTATFRDVQPGAYRVGGLAPGFAMSLRDGEVSGATEFEVELAAESSIFGRAWTPGDVPSFEVFVTDLATDLVWDEQFEDPEFRIGGLPSGAYSVELKYSGGVSMDLGIYSLAAGQSLDLGSIANPASGRIMGAVGGSAATTISSGEAQLYRFLETEAGFAESVAVVQLDGQGEFVFEGLLAGEYEVSLRPEGAAPQVLRQIRVQPGESVDLGMIQLDLPMRVELQVWGPDGEPLAGVSVGVASMERTHGLSTNSSGLAVAYEVVPGAVLGSIMLPEGVETVRGEGLPGETVHLELRLAEVQRRTIRGALTDADGAPCAGGSIECLAADGSWFSSGSMLGPQGSFELSGKLQGLALFEITLEGAARRKIFMTRDLGQGASDSELALLLPSGRLELTGPEGAARVLVRYSDWEGLRHCPLLISRQATFIERELDADRHVSIEYLIKGTYEMDWLSNDGALLGTLTEQL